MGAVARFLHWNGGEGRISSPSQNGRPLRRYDAADGNFVVPKEGEMSGASDRGRFFWYDLMTPDPEAAKAFYTAVMGWGTELWEGQGMSYTMWTAGGAPMGGTMKLPDEAVAGGARPHWLAYVGVPDVDAAASRARELGGKVMVPPTTIPDIGRFSVLADPQGATVAAYKPDKAYPEPDGMPPVGHFSWHELATPEPDAVFAFYEDLFGWEKTSTFDMGAMGMYQLFGRRGQAFGGIFNKPAEMPGPPAWLHYGRVADVNAAVEAVRQHGGQVLHGPMEVPGGDQIVMVLDAQGGPFAVHQSMSE
jgi:predicted enzyme related to lactoylglutathione lyase